MVVRTSPAFQRSAICIDKLGLTVRPLLDPESIPKAASSGKGAEPVSNGSGRGVVAVSTEAVSFPISAVVQIVDGSGEMELAPQEAQAESEMRANPPSAQSGQPAAPPAPPAPDPPAAGPRTGHTGAPPGAPPRAGPGEAPRTGAPSANRTPHLPFARVLGLWGSRTPGAAAAARERPRPPHPHVVSIQVKGSLAVRHQGADRAPLQMRLRAQPPPPVVALVSFRTKDEALRLVSRVLAFKKYTLSVALAAHLNTFTAVSQREAELQGRRLADEGAVAQRMQHCDIASSFEPPPLPPRPADLPPPSRLPRMVTNDEGEVFWYIPRKRRPREQKASTAPEQPRFSMSAGPPQKPSSGLEPPPDPPPDPSPPDVGAEALGPVDTPPPDLSTPTPSPGRPSKGSAGTRPSEMRDVGTVFL